MSGLGLLAKNDQKWGLFRGDGDLASVFEKKKKKKKKKNPDAKGFGFASEKIFKSRQAKGFFGQNWSKWPILGKSAFTLTSRDKNM